VTRGRLGKPGGAYRILDSALQHGFVEMVPAPLPRDAIHIETRGRENPLPGPVAARLPVLTNESARQLDPAGTAPKVGLVLRARARGV
jgi:hypothetical protein